ncbi:MAG TPA: two-component regulator propeller domain-containing protein [Flavobacterium sp.]|nr:two-component regulator propeller domain-containing protein [Flavobacterium sp.]
MKRPFIQTPGIILLTLLAFVTICKAQTKLIRTQGSDKYQNVHCGLQDKSGNLWFGTTGEGIYRYNGKSFTQFTVKDGLSSNTVWSILEDLNGNIWCGTAAGISLYDGKTLTAVPISTTNEIKEKNEVFSMIQDKSGLIWFGTTTGVYYYNGNFFTRLLDNGNITNADSVTLKSVQCMLADKDGNIWFGSGPMAFEGICRYDGKSITNFKPNGEGWVRNMIEDKNGTIWVASRYRGIYRYDGKAFTAFAEKEAFSKTGTGAILEDKTGNIWFASLGKDEDDGVWCFDGKAFKNFTTKDGLNNNTVFCILEDRSGNLWFGTNGTGLCYYNGKKFVNLTE